MRCAGGPSASRGRDLVPLRVPFRRSITRIPEESRKQTEEEERNGDEQGQIQKADNWMIGGYLIPIPPYLCSLYLSI